MDYGIYKALANENYYTHIARCINSAVCTEGTKRTLRRITGKSIRYAHMGQLLIRDGMCYSTFLQNPGDDGEGHDSSSSGVVLAVFSLERALDEDFDPECDVEIYPVGSKGDTCAGRVAHSIFKDNSMCFQGEKLQVCFSFICEDGRSRIFRKTFDPHTVTWCDESEVMLEYRGQLLEFSDSSINKVYTDKGLEPRAKGLIELVSAWSEYGGEYYATGITIDGANNGFVVKTSDFTVMTLVDAIPFNDMGTAEVASYVFKDRLFVACRQDYGIPYLYFSCLDLKTGQWQKNYKIPDGNSRPWFFEHGGELYLLYSPDELYRRYSNIARVRVLHSGHNFYDNVNPTEVVATLADCGSYFATAEYGGEIYFVSTRDTESFGRLHLELCDPESTQKKLIGLFS